MEETKGWGERVMVQKTKMNVVYLYENLLLKYKGWQPTWLTNAISNNHEILCKISSPRCGESTHQLMVKEATGGSQNNTGYCHIFWFPTRTS